MRTLAALVAVLLGCGVALAQPRNSRSYGSGSGFGNVVFPGTGRAPMAPGASGFGNVVFPGGVPRLNTFSITDPSFATGLAGIVSGRAPYSSMFRGNANRRYVYTPYAYPVYVGGYGSYVDQPYQQQPNVTVFYQQQPQPPVVINQSFGAAPAQPLVQEIGPQDAAGDSTGIRVYQGPTRTAEEMSAAVPEATYYLIAFQDHSIYSAVAYYVEGDTLHYFTQGNVHNQVSLSLVDRALTEQLNRERNVNVKLSVSK